MLKPKGDLVADVLAAIARLVEERRRVILRRIGMAALLVSFASALWWWQFPARDVIAIEATAHRESSGFRLDLQIENMTPRAITVVDALAWGDEPAAGEARAELTPYDLNPNETKSVVVPNAWAGGAAPSTWKACFGYVDADSMDRFKWEMAQVRDTQVFIRGVNTADQARHDIAARYRREACTSSKPLPR
jgi:hypothetical protein